MKSIIKSAKTIEEAVELGLQELGLKREEVEVEVIAEPTKGLFGIFGGNDATVKVKKKEKLKIDIDEIFSNTESFGQKDSEEEARDKEIEEKYEEITEQVEEFEQDIAESSKELDEDFDTSFEDNDFESESSSFEEDEKDSEAELSTSNIDLSSELVDSENLVNEDDNLESAAEKTKTILEDLLSRMHIDAKVSYELLEDNTINLAISDISENDTGIVIGSKGETLNAIQYILSLITNSNSNQFYRITLDVADYRERRKKSIEANAQKVAFRVLKTKKSIALKPMNSYERRIVHYALQNYKGIETVSTGKFPNRKVIIKYEDQ